MAEMIENDQTGITAETNTKELKDLSELTSPSETATEEYVATLKSKGYTWLLLGVTGAGKSCLGNFLLGKGDAFQEAEEFKPLQAVTKTASYKDGIACDSDGLERNLLVIDTPGLGDTQYLGKYDSKAKDIAEDTSAFAMELTKMTMWMRGIIAFLVVIPSHVREHSGTMNMLDCFEILGNYWNHAILVLTQGKRLGRTEDDQYEYFEDVVGGAHCPPIWETLLKKVNDRYIIVEGKDWRHNSNYRNSVHRKLMSFSDDMTTQHGPYQDDLNSIANKAVEKAKLELREEYDNFKTKEAERAIFKSAKKHLMKVIEKLVQIKQAGGVDVDKLKEINEVKQRELENLTEEAENLQRKWEEEVQKRRMAEEKRLEEERSRMKAELEVRYERERKEEAEKRNIQAEHNKILIEKQLNAAEEEKRQAKQKTSQEVEKRKIAEQQKEDERLKREQAEKQKQEAEKQKEIETGKRKLAEKDREMAEQQKEYERSKKEQAEQQREDERLKREQAEQQKEDERLRREQAEQQREDERSRRAQAEQQKEDERLRRERAEQQREDERSRRAQAEQQKEDERLRRAQAEQQKEVERLRREQAEEQKEDERLRREQAEEQKEDERLRREQAEEQKEDERLRREIAEQQKEEAQQAEQMAENRVRQRVQELEALQNRGLFRRVFNMRPKK